MQPSNHLWSCISKTLHRRLKRRIVGGLICLDGDGYGLLHHGLREALFTVCGDIREGRHEMVQVSIDGSRQPQSAEADVVQCLVIQQHALVHMLAEQVEAEDYVVWLHRRVGHLGRRNDREGLHDAIGVSLTYLQDLKSSHT